MIKVHVLSGGNSPEREVSLRSGMSVATALQAVGYSVTTLDSSITTFNEIVDCDIVFPVLHGVGGEDGVVQAELEQYSSKFVGSGSKASALCFDKWQYRQVITEAGLPMPKADVIAQEHYSIHELAQNLHVLKPITGGSSIDTFIVRDMANIPHESIKETFERYPTMLIEELIDGTELTVGILNDTALPIIEIIPPENADFDFVNKYNGATQELCPPENVTANIQKAAKDLALQAHHLTGCRDFSRTDIMVNPSGELFLLETNTIPGMTDQSLFPKMAATAGITMPELCRQLVELARHHV